MTYANVKPKNLLAMNPRHHEKIALDAIINFDDDDDYVVSFELKSNKFKREAKRLNEILLVEYRLNYVNSYFICEYYPAGFVVEHELKILRK